MADRLAPASARLRIAPLPCPGPDSGQRSLLFRGANPQAPLYPAAAARTGSRADFAGLRRPEQFAQDASPRPRNRACSETATGASSSALQDLASTLDGAEQSRHGIPGNAPGIEPGAGYPTTASYESVTPTPKHPLRPPPRRTTPQSGISQDRMLDFHTRILHDFRWNLGGRGISVHQGF